MRAWLGPTADVALAAAIVGGVVRPESGLLGVVVGGLVCLVVPRPSRERLILALALMLAPGVGLLLEASRPAEIKRVEPAWQELVAQLEQAATKVAGTLQVPSGSARDSPSVLFGQLAAGSVAYRQQGFSFIVVDRDGEPRAWAGEGLLHEPAASEIPERGFVGWSGWSAATVAAVAPLDSHPRPWRVVAGTSLSTTRFEPAAVEGLRWRIAGSSTTSRSGFERIAGAAGPHTTLGSPDLLIDSRALRPRVPFRAIWLLIPLAVLTAIWASRWQRSRGLLAAAGLGGTLGTAAWVAGAGGAGWGLAIAVVALARAWEVRWRPRRAAEAVAMVTSGLCVALLASAAWDYHHRRTTADLLAGDASRLPEVGWLLVLTLLIWTVLLVAVRWFEPHSTGGVGARFVTASALALGGAALTAWPSLAVIVAVAAAAAVVAACGGAGVVAERRGRIALLALFGSLIAGTLWEAGRRSGLDQHAREWADRSVGVDNAKLDDLEARLNAGFRRVELDRISPFAEDGDLDDSDLAASLWRNSQLASYSGLSAVALAPETGAPLKFSVGLPLTESGQLDQEPQRWRDLGVPGRHDLMVTGEGEVWRAGQRWGTLRWWLLPSPGQGPEPAGDPLGPTVALLRDADNVRGWMPRLPEPLVVALIDGEERVIAAPWRTALATAHDGEMVETPHGRARAWTRPWREGSQIVVYAPRPSLFGSIERVVALALGVVLALLGPALVATIGAGWLPRLGRFARDSWRSYPRRLAMVYATLLLVPLVVLHLVFAQVLAERLRSEQRAAGETALRAAERVLGEYVENLPPGFGLATEIDDAFLVWLSRAVQHDLNLYWGAQLVASSKRELIDAGFLPERIPGEIYLALGLQREELGVRTNRTAGVRYTELYAPVHILGQPSNSSRLVLGMPLLDVEQNIEREISELRRQSLVVVVLLFGALLSLGLRLSRGFTRPIADMVAGTRRIAGGAAELGFAPPEERELAELATAIDDMARRIAEGRHQLVRGKQVVERVIDHVTAGVVSLDQAGRVLLLNRVAVELLGVSPGAKLSEVLRATTSLEKLWCFLDDARGGPLLERTVRIPASSGEREWRAVWVPLPAGPDDDAAGLFIVEDATEALRAERLAAWAEMARMIAHEIKNPLTPIRLSAEHLREVWRRDPERVDAVLERCVANILSQVEELRQISSDFSSYAHIPEIKKQPADLRELAVELVEAYTASADAPVSVRLVAAMESLPVALDRRPFSRAVRNLLENAIRASPVGGVVEVVLAQDHQSASLTVLDRGPGVPELHLARIFDPYFSTHDTGTGLGLPISRRIVEEHGGELIASNRPGGGLAVTCTIPRR